jgi:tight adherence protein C
MNEMTLLVLCVFGAVAMLAFFVLRLVLGAGKDTRLHGRLIANTSPGAHPVDAPARGVTPLIQRVGQVAAQPFMPKTREKQSSLRRELGYAGIYSPAAMKVMTGFKFICLITGLAGGYAAAIATGQMMMCLSVGGLVGYLLPTLWLRQRVKRNQSELQYGLADGLDLMVICVEAGLTIDAAMQRVGQELALAHPAISRELAITYMETRVGLSRAEALKNLGTRTGNPPLQSLGAMLTQADRFGTSIANALRIHADTLRQQRQHAAEELAAKASVKMSFPLVLFIFPATFIVIGGPIVIGLMKSGMF